jgi:phage-related protein
MICAAQDDARRRAGFELHQVQQGASADRLEAAEQHRYRGRGNPHHTATQHRVFYVARFEEAVYVLHTFEKKTQKTSAGMSRSPGGDWLWSWQVGEPVTSNGGRDE